MVVFGGNVVSIAVMINKVESYWCLRRDIEVNGQMVNILIQSTLNSITTKKVETKWEKLMLCLATIFILVAWFYQPFSVIIYWLTGNSMPGMIWKFLAILLYGFYIIVGKTYLRIQPLVIVKVIVLIILLSLLFWAHDVELHLLLSSLKHYLVFILLVGLPAVGGKNIQAKTVDTLERIMYRFVTVLAFPLFLIGIIQFTLDEPIFVPIVWEALRIDPDIAIPIWNFYGNTRATSLFVSSGYFIVFVNLVFLLSFAVFLRGKGCRRRIFAFLLMSISIVVLYMTLTRTGYIQLLIGIVVLLLLKLSIHYPRLLNTRRILVLNLLITFCIVVASLYIYTTGSDLLTSANLLSTESLGTRYLNWQKILTAVHPDQLNFWFGNFINGNNISINEGKFMLSDSPDAIIVDNGYISLFIFGGVVFLVVIVWGILKSLYLALDTARSRDSPISLGLAAFLSSLLVANFYGSLMDQYAFGISLFFVLYWWESKDQNCGLRAKLLVVNNC